MSLTLISFTVFAFAQVFVQKAASLKREKEKLMYHNMDV